MEFREVVRRRRMVRRFGPQPVAPEVVDRLVAHAQRAPSAGFSQGTAYLVLDTPDDVARFWEATTPSSVEQRGTSVSRPTNAWLDGMRTAPLLIVPVTDPAAYAGRYAEADKRQDAAAWPVPWWWVDAGMGSLLILQTAVDEGLGACFFGIPPERRAAFREAFGVPADLEPVGAVAVGHRTDDTGSGGSPSRRSRRTDLARRGRWGTTFTA